MLPFCAVVRMATVVVLARRSVRTEDADRRLGRRLLKAAQAVGVPTGRHYAPAPGYRLPVGGKKCEGKHFGDEPLPLGGPRKLTEPSRRLSGVAG